MLDHNHQKILVSIFSKVSCLSACKKINCITHFFLNMLYRNSKLVILGNLGMPGHTHLKWQYQFEKSFNIYQQAENQLHPSCFPWDIAKIFKLVVFATFGLSGYGQPKWYYHLVEKLCVYLQAITVFICKGMQTYFGYFAYAWLNSPKMIVLLCRRLWCLSACKK